MVEKQVQDVGNDVEDVIEKIIINWTKYFVKGVEQLPGEIDNKTLNELVITNAELISEINIVNSDGIIIYSSDPNFVGFDMKESEKTAEFMCLLQGQDYYEQDIRPNILTNEEMWYVGMAIPSNNSFVQVGISKENYENLFKMSIRETAKNYNIGVSGGIIVCDKEYNVIACTEDEYIGLSLDNKDILPASVGEKTSVEAKVFGKNSYVVAENRGDYYVIGAYPTEEMSSITTMNTVLNVLTFLIILLGAILIFTGLYNKYVIKNLDRVNESLKKITSGDLDERVEGYDTIEFNVLSDGINKTVDRLKDMISEADERVKMELEMARNIQQMSLPECIDVYRNNSRFSLYAYMETAKIVGGDFYDFYMVSQDILVATMADVSDKGIPAAMFMMRAKTLMKSLAGEGLSVEEMATQANKALWENNDGNMFVTAWIGFINVETGLVKYVHAGHTCPVVFRNADSYFVKKEREMLMGSIDDLEYHEQEFTLQSGDCLFLYTDGVIEAEDVEGNFYGKERLLTELDGMN
ncbi:MAG: SpoIIE family protein phosphatase, partial [Lachnospiraceae bacterium]|nr:SpoIIE family protein phosphatase [Lachnospiraceae bacterium]